MGVQRCVGFNGNNGGGSCGVRVEWRGGSWSGVSGVRGRSGGRWARPGNAVEEEEEEDEEGKGVGSGGAEDVGGCKRRK